MSRQDYVGSPAGASGAGSPAASAGADGHASQQRPSRRAVLRGAAGAGAAGVAATALSGLGGSALAAEPRAGRGAGHQAAADAAADGSEQFVVHVRDAKAGHIDVFRGTGLVQLRDRELARLLDRLSRR